MNFNESQKSIIRMIKFKGTVLISSKINYPYIRWCFVSLLPLPLPISSDVCTHFTAYKLVD